MIINDSVKIGGKIHEITNLFKKPFTMFNHLKTLPCTAIPQGSVKPFGGDKGEDRPYFQFSGGC